MFLDHFCDFIDRIRSKVIPKMIMHSVYLTDFVWKYFPFYVIVMACNIVTPP